MIAATLHWLLIAMWHANHLINSHGISESENQTLPKNTRHVFMNEMEHFNVPTDSKYELPVSEMESMYAYSLHHVSPFGKYRHQLFTIFRFVNPHNFNFLPELSKMYWVGDLARFEQRSVGWVTGTKQLFCHGLSVFLAKMRFWYQNNPCTNVKLCTSCTYISCYQQKCEGPKCISEAIQLLLVWAKRSQVHRFP